MKPIYLFRVSLFIFAANFSQAVEEVKQPPLLFRPEKMETIQAEPGPFKPTWDSLQTHAAVPEWMRDAKFGIYCHWGIYSVPAYNNEHYCKHMHDDSGHSKLGTFERQIGIYGPLEKFDYHDFIPMFKGEQFDADQWADLFQKAGARFAGPVAEHEDGFAMWDSTATPFNAKAMGPHRDIVGELEKAIRSRGMKFFVSLHNGIHNTNVKLKPGWAGSDPKYAKLYGSTMPHDEWLAMWEAKCNEVVDQYHPDIFYNDVGLDQIPDANKQRFIAHYFNDAASQGREVIVTYKHDDLPAGVGMLDHESAHPTKIIAEPWLCDYPIGTGMFTSWGYTEGMELRSARDIVEKLIEIVANNGQMLLNLSPKADGTIPDDQRQIALKVGQWLWSFGEAIYGTRPLKVAGETLAGDQRVFYTRKGKYLYAIFLTWPGAGKTLTLRELAPGRIGGSIASAQLIGMRKLEPCAFTANDHGLELTLPKATQMPSDLASVVRLEVQ